MANNFFGGYSPPQQQFLQYQQPQTNNNGVIVVTVQGEAGARVYPVAAGNTVLLIDFDAKKFWLKSTDLNGMPSRFATFNFAEEIQQQGGDTVNFISRNEFNDLKKSIDNQFKQLSEYIKGAINNVPAVSTNGQPSNVSATI